MIIFGKKEKERLKKIGIDTILDLSLSLPKGYEDNFIKNFPKIGFENVIDATVLHIQNMGKFLKIRLFAHNFNQEMTGIVFHPKPFHKKVFRVDERFFLRGKIEFSFNTFSIVQPKIIKEINTIKVKYKNKTIQEMADRYITLDNLISEGILEDIAQDIVMLHKPTVEFIENFQQNGYTERLKDGLKFVEIYNYLKKLSKKKVQYKSICKLNSDVSGFISSLPFRLTNDQLRCVEDIKRDFNSSFAAKRVIMGDVGCGKTVVMFASVMMAYPQKSLLMVPTSILAMQIYEEAKKLLPKELKMVLVTSKSKDEDLSNYDFIIGTHALMYRDVPRCELVMIDEQHRFGVKQREFIKNRVAFQKDKRVHFLQFSATPIPRTMAMINSSVVDYSFIKEMPFKKDITTKIIRKKDFANLLAHIDKEIAKNHQIIIIYPLVEESENIEYHSIEEAKSYWLKRYRDTYVTFGKDKDKESILEEFRDKGSLLISTTVVEVGISLPRLTTIVIVGAERLGFATLHQIRGRVSRTGLKGYCFLYTNQNSNKRLEEFAKITSGFDIAELDLKFRQSGDLLNGKAQSGQLFKWIDLAKDEEIIKKAKMTIK